jgi:hypothetical protein
MGERPVMRAEIERSFGRPNAATDGAQFCDSIGARSVDGSALASPCAQQTAATRQSFKSFSAESA